MPPADERAKELARNQRREEYKRLKEHRAKLRAESKTQKAAEKEQARQSKDDALWSQLQTADKLEDESES